MLGIFSPKAGFPVSQFYIAVFVDSETNFMLDPVLQSLVLSLTTNHRSQHIILVSHVNDTLCGYGVNYNDLADSFPPPTTGTPHTDHGSVTW
jgi:hypothetical protein